MSKLNSAVSNIQTGIEESTTESIWIKILPYIILLVGLLISTLIIVRAIKK